MKTLKFSIPFIVGLFCLSSQLLSQVSLPALFSDNMVLQQKTETPIWGKASPGDNIKIVTSWNNKVYNVKTDSEGDWIIAVETPSAGGPYEIGINDNKELTFKNVMIGEVWVASGQSNMEMPLAGWGQIIDYEKEISEANYPNIRLFQVEKATSSYPLEDVSVSGGGWQECSSATIPEFSATAYFFARELYNNLNIPIGIIHTSWGGTLAEAWTSLESLKMMPDFKERSEEFASLPKDKEEQRIYFSEKQKEWNNKVNNLDFGIQDNKPVAALTTYQDNNWNTMSLPGFWSGDEMSDFDGFVWFRKTITIPEDWAGNNLILSLGGIDDDDETFFNGEKIGELRGAGIERKYEIPAELVKEGTATITVRVLDTGGPGGFTGNEHDMYIAPVGKETLRENLNNEWKFKPSVNLNEVGNMPQNSIESPHNPSTLYNAMMAPIVPFGIKGAIWYQGESNAGRAYQYRTLFPLMINDWRTKWGVDFPFYYVQLANFMEIRDEPGESQWAELREAQLKTLNLTNTGMAVIIDIGDADDIHPKNKQDVGKRLALLALSDTYDKNIVSMGPLYDSYLITGKEIQISFKPSDSPLTTSDGEPLKGFSIAGPDKKFYWADAVIKGDKVIVSSPEVPFPVAVRYAWADNPVCNLANKEGLPASPFKTDDWSGLTITNR